MAIKLVFHETIIYTVRDPFWNPFFAETLSLHAPPKKKKSVTHGFHNEYAPKSLELDGL